MPVSKDPSKRSKVNTRARLLDAAYEVIAEVGFEAATVERICVAAGFTRGAFYGSFDSKVELFFALWAARASLVLEDLNSAAAQLAASPESMDTVIDDFVRHVTNDRRWFLVSSELINYCVRHEDVAAAYVEHRRELREGVGQIVAVIWERRGTPRSEVQSEWCARQLIAAIDGSQRQVWMEPDTLGDGALQIEMVRALLR